MKNFEDLKARIEEEHPSRVDSLIEKLQGDIREAHGLDREWTPQIKKRE